MFVKNKFWLLALLVGCLTVGYKAQASTSNNAQTASVTKKAASHKKKTNKGRSSMIPPPPPSTPIGGQFVYISGVPISSMSEKELKTKVADLNDEVAKYSLQLDRTKRQADYKKKRAESFVDLYKDGVISRRELEAAQDEAAGVDAQVADAESQLKEVQTEAKQAKDALADIEKAHQKKKSISQNKKTHL